MDIFNTESFKNIWNPNTRGWKVLAKKGATEACDSEQVNYFKNTILRLLAFLFYVDL